MSFNGFSWPFHRALCRVAGSSDGRLLMRRWNRDGPCYQSDRLQLATVPLQKQSRMQHSIWLVNDLLLLLQAFRLVDEEHMITLSPLCFCWLNYIYMRLIELYWFLSYQSFMNECIHTTWITNIIISGLPLTQDIKIPWLFPNLSLTYLHFSLTNQTYKY